MPFSHIVFKVLNTSVFLGQAAEQVLAEAIDFAAPCGCTPPPRVILLRMESEQGSESAASSRAASECSENCSMYQDEPNLADGQHGCPWPEIPAQHGEAATTQLPGTCMSVVLLDEAMRQTSAVA